MFAKQAKLHDRPGHAGIGAFVSSGLLERLGTNENFANAISNAIAKHHSPHNDTLSDFQTTDTSYKEIEILFKEVGITGNLIKKGKRGVIDCIRNEGEYLLYFFLSANTKTLRSKGNREC